METLFETICLYGKDGAKYNARIFQEWIDTSSHDGLDRIPGMKRAMLTNGHHLNYVDENTFRNVETGELLSRKNPR